MMVKSIKIDGVISKIIRDTRIPDSSYISDMHEWIAEAMGLMRTHAELVPDYAVVPIVFHVGKLPCCISDLEAVEYNGTRLGHYAGIRYPSQNKMSAEDPVFVTEVTTSTMPTGPVMDLTVVTALPVNQSEGYKVFIDHILTTFADGEVTIYYKKILTDERGLPLIPDHADYREALYWFNRAKVIGTGYEDPVYGHDDRVPMERFEKYAARAIGDITYPSVDEKESQLVGQVHFVPPLDYYDSFFNTVNGEPPMGYGMTGSNFVRAATATLNNGTTSN